MKYREDEDIIRDGESVRVPLYLMDGVQKEISAHRPRQLVADAHTLGVRAVADAAYDEMLANLKDAWRTKTKDDDDLAAAMHRRQIKKEHDAYEKFKDDLSQAWRQPMSMTHPYAANAIERQGERWRGDR